MDMNNSPKLTIPTTGTGGRLDPITPVDPRECFIDNDLLVLMTTSMRQCNTLLALDYGKVRIVQPNGTILCTTLPITKEVQDWITENF